MIIFIIIICLVGNAGLQGMQNIEMQQMGTVCCGICKRPGIEVSWSNKFSNGAHKKCYELIAPFEKDVIENVKILYPYNSDKQKNLLITFAAELQNICRPSIKDFLAKEGQEGLKSRYKQVEDTILKEEFELRKAALIAQGEYLSKIY